MTSHNLLPEPPPTLLPVDSRAHAALTARDADPFAVAAAHPTFSAAWAALAEAELTAATAGADTPLPHQVRGYAFARTGYHRGLDALRRAGWRGSGPVPWSHEPNRGFLRCLAALGRAAAAIGEDDEAARCVTFLADCDPAAADELS